MSRPFPCRSLAVFALLSLVSTLAASVCPTCEVDFHVSRAAGDSGVALRFGGDWGAESAACTCCEDVCAETYELPDGRIRRVALTAAVLPAAAAVDILPPRLSEARAPAPQAVFPPPRVRLHLRNASFLC